MSAAHSPGRLAAFTQYAVPEIRDDSDNTVAVVWYHNLANARRLVACWNACEGLSTEALEIDGNLANGWRLASYAMRDAIAQRDELLAALRDARRWIGDGDLSDGLSREHWTPEYIKAVDSIDAAIAKATGQEGGAL